MADITPRFYKKEITDALAAESLKFALFTSTLVPSASTSELYSSLTGEVSSVGTGYTTGGATVADKVSAYKDTINASLDASDFSWSSATFTARYGVLYNTANSKIRAIYDFGADVPVSNGTLTITVHADGLIKVS